MIFFTEQKTPLGAMLLATTERGIRGIYFPGQKHFSGTQGWRSAASHPHLQQAALQLEEYFSHLRTRFDVPLDLGGTEFQQAVWQRLLDIPFGQTTTYAQHALSIGRPKALRAVSAAIGRNPVSIIVPCHRVIGSDGSATGYAGGIHRKLRLLDLEGVLISPGH
jgi:methylated-DNA-[protein]-cysteine S-methyltransferase